MKMFAIDSSLSLDALPIFSLAFLIDVVFGEVPDNIHPTLCIEKVTAYLKSKLRNKNSKIEKFNGVILFLLLMALLVVPVYVILFLDLRLNIISYSQLVLQICLQRFCRHNRTHFFQQPYCGS
jgi:cobalamin biosynthesis protein CobD/CbiB